MMNNCRFLNLTLQICSQSNAVCPYMTDPDSCAFYEEEFGQIPPTTPDWVDKIPKTPEPEPKRIDMEVESFGDFAERMEAELNGLGVKVERIEEPPDWF